MNIWNILEIEPTTDKMLIKKAYAKQSKEIHPEEKPEEFQRLYDAYQKALEYAKNGSKPAKENTEGQLKKGVVVRHRTEAKEEEQRKEPEDTQGLTDFFSEKLRAKSACMEKFYGAWDQLCRRYGLPGENEKWEEFLESEEFKEIQMDPQVIEKIADGLKGKLKYEDECHVALWEAYHFTEEAGSQYCGTERLLYDVLFPVIRKRKKERERKEAEYKWEEKDNKTRKGLKKAGMIAACLLSVFLLFFSFFQVMEQRWAVLGYMNRKYPGVEFSKPRDQGEKGTHGEKFYTLYPHDQPEQEIIVTLRDRGSGGNKYLLSDNYGEQLMQQYAQPYGIKVSTGVNIWYGGSGNEIYTFYYEDMDDISRFSQSFYELLNDMGEKNISFVEQVSFCAENIFFPEMMMEEGRGGLWESLTFPINDLPQPEELGNILKETYVEYLYQYEAWNLTPAQEAEYGQEYVAEGRKREEESKEDSSSESGWALEDLRRTEEEAGLYLPVYKEAGYNQYQYTANITYYITLGSAYQYLKAKGLPVLRTEDGKGFTVQVQDITYEMKDFTEIKLNDIYEMVRSAEKVR